jgi:hypothetical protein
VSAAVSLPAAEDLAHAWTLYAEGVRLADEGLRRLARLEGGLVRVLDAIDEANEDIARAQTIQIDALRLVAMLKETRR